MEFKKFQEAITGINNVKLPGQNAQFKMSPPFRTELLKRQQKVIKLAKQAGVVALFYPNINKQTTLVLILRQTYKGVHSAQIGFPGGKYEAEDETMSQTALRETYEEIGVPSKNITLIKTLTTVYIPPSNFYVHPFLGICNQTPNFKKQDAEVKRIIEVPLAELLDDTNICNIDVVTSYAKNIKVPCIKLQNYEVWGATAMMLSEIRDLLKQVL